MMWWEPWELSAGEVYAILPKLPRASFGLIIHANIAEAQLALPVDGWFRLTARLCFWPCFTYRLRRANSGRRSN